MKRILLRAAFLGALAMAGVAVGGTSAMAQCAVPGSTDCPLTPNPYGSHPEGLQQRLPNGGGDPAWNNPGIVNPPAVNNWQGRRYHQRWRNGWNDGPRVYVDRYVPVYPPSHYYDDYDDDYYYDRPRYRVAPRRAARIYLSEEHVEWCYDRYRTYRESDNTYKRTRTKRAQCISPFS